MMERFSEGSERGQPLGLGPGPTAGAAAACI